MSQITTWSKRVCCTSLIASALVLTGSGASLADRPGRYDDRYDRREHRADHPGKGYRHAQQNHYRKHPREHRKSPHVIHRGKKRAVPHDRVRWYRDVVIIRPHGRWYPGYAYHFHDDDAYKWLAFTAITLGVLDFLNEEQQREHEAAQVAATTAPLGEQIIWREGNASGAVTATREGVSTSGRYCREFQQEVSIGGRTEQAYGTACRKPDGSWEVISVESP